jgi:hypothetical protein
LTTLLLLLVMAQPNHQLTPGQVRDLSLQVVCTTKWGLDARHVSTSMRKEVFRRYGIPWAARAAYVVDHLIPRELAGDDVLENLWVQLLAESKVKDVEEKRLHREVCRTGATLTLAEAQRQMASWQPPR